MFLDAPIALNPIWNQMIQRTGALYRKVLIWLSGNMNAKPLERLAIGEGIGTRNMSFKRYTAPASTK
jgi:hypothetical protein